MKEIPTWKTGMSPEAGQFYAGMPNEVYHGLSDWNGSSMLKHALRSVESYFYEKEQPHKHTLALERGGALREERAMTVVTKSATAITRRTSC